MAENPRTFRECPIESCDTKHSRSKMMCRDHWYMVPKPLRDELWAAYREHGVISEEYIESRQACIAAVEEALRA